MARYSENDQSHGAYLDYLARCSQAFTPFAPIELPDFFAGRAHVVEDIRRELQAPGRQVAIYGERGVGKTSLATLLYFFARYDDDNVYLQRCQDTTTFEDICHFLLNATGRQLSINGAQAEAGRSGEAKVGPLSAGVSRRTTLTYRAAADAQAVSIARLLEIFQSRHGLLILDEFDRVRDAATKTRVAEMIKHFSDARSQTKIVVVGVGETVSELIGEHQSLSRSLAQVGLKRMDEQELMDIVRRGSERAGVRFDRSVATRTVRLADGFPHFVHLICLYASHYAGSVLQAEGDRRPYVGETEYHLGLKSAIEKSEHTLQEGYDSAVVTTRRKSDIYELTLRAMALSRERDVQVRELADHASFLAGTALRPEKFSSALGELIKPDRGAILKRVRDGYYKFANPLMRPYVRLQLELENLAVHGGQLEFPFMRPASA